MNEKRNEARIGTAFIVKCTVLPDENQSFYTVCNDLNSLGLKIFSENFLPLGKILKLDINLLTSTAEAKAKVVWHNNMKSMRRYDIGLKYLELNDTNRAKLVNFINTVNNKKDYKYDAK